MAKQTRAAADWTAPVPLANPIQAVATECKVLRISGDCLHGWTGPAVSTVGILASTVRQMESCRSMVLRGPLAMFVDDPERGEHHDQHRGDFEREAGMPAEPILEMMSSR